MKNEAVELVNGGLLGNFDKFFNRMKSPLNVVM